MRIDARRELYVSQLVTTVARCLEGAAEGIGLDYHGLRNGHTLITGSRTLPGKRAARGVQKAGQRWSWRLKAGTWTKR